MMNRYTIGRGGEDEPGLILIADNEEHTIVARSSDMALDDVKELVRLANLGASHYQTPTLVELNPKDHPCNSQP